MQPDEVAQVLAAVRARRPLVHNITNYVVMDFTANALLALGASPVMAHAVEEVEEMAALAGALVINIGTLSTTWIDAMFRAARVARKLGKPVILDPVGAGATRLRTDTARRLLEERLVTLVRGNASEIRALAGLSAQTRGVDATDDANDARVAATQMACDFEVIASLTGVVDWVTDGKRSCAIANGHALMARVTGTGCVASAISGACCAVETDGLKAAAAALAIWGLAGELAARENPHPGTYRTLLIDGLAEITADDIRSQTRFD